MMSLRRHQEDQLKSQNRNQKLKKDNHMHSEDYYKEKYKNYERKNTLKGWIFHIYLVFLSLFMKKKYYK